jgi:hypothetical protein
MARRKYGKPIAKVFAAVILLIVTIVGFSYGSLLHGMNRGC